MIPRPQNVRTQTLLLTIATLLALGAVVVMLGGYVTHRLKQHLVRESNELVNEQVARTTRELSEMVRAGSPRSLSSDNPNVMTALRVLVNSGATESVELRLHDQYIVIRRSGDPSHPGPIEEVHKLEPTQSMTTKLAGSSSITVFNESASGGILNAARTDRVPIKDSAGQTLAYMDYVSAGSLAANRVLGISEVIDESLRWMVGITLLLLACSGVLLYKVFNRLLRLQHERDSQQRMATIGTLASGLAHEIRNPLQIINLNLDVIREDMEESSAPATAGGVRRGAALNSEQTLKMLAGVQDQIGHLNGILKDFLNYAIPGRMEMEPMNLRPAIAGVLDLAAPQLKSHGVALEFRCPEDARIIGDASGLRQVFLNLILNACHAMEKSSEKKLSILVEREGPSHWRMRVSDTGCGIPEGKEEAIFEAMVSFRKGGTGFGLAIARRIIEEHDGRIMARNLPGGGAQFTLTLRSVEQ